MNNNNTSPFTSREPTPSEQQNTFRLTCVVLIVIIVFLIVFTCI